MGQALSRFHRTPSTVPMAHLLALEQGPRLAAAPHSLLTTSGLRRFSSPQASPALPGTVGADSLRSDPRPGQSYMCSWPACFSFYRVHGLLPQSLIYTQQRHAGQKARRADPESQWTPSRGKNAFALRSNTNHSLCWQTHVGVCCAEFPLLSFFSGGPYP